MICNYVNSVFNTGDFLLLVTVLLYVVSVPHVFTVPRQKSTFRQLDDSTFLQADLCPIPRLNKANTVQRIRFHNATFDGLPLYSVFKEDTVLKPLSDREQCPGG